MAPRYAKDEPAGFTNRIERVAIVGAGGTVGKYLAEALVKTGKHTVTAITRAESTNKLPQGVNVAKVNYEDESTLVEALKGQQFLIITMKNIAPEDTQTKIIHAAARAGVPYVMPNHFGPDIQNEKLMTDIIIGGRVIGATRQLEDLGITHIVMSCMFWFEFSLLGGQDRYGFDFNNNSVIFFDDGNEKINTSTLDQCGRAIAALLSLNILPKDENDKSTTISKWFNKPLYISSFLVSQKDMFEGVKRVTGTADKDWKISHENSAERFKSGLDRVMQGDRSGFAKLLYTRLFFPIGDGNFEAKYELANDALGLPKEDFDEVIKAGIAAWKAGELVPY